MQLTITGRHGRITGSMRQRARESAERLADHFAQLSRMQITLDTDGSKFEVEIIASVRRGAPMVAHARNDDMHAAIDVSFEKLTTQLRRLKDRVKDHHAASRGEALQSEAGEEAAPIADEEGES